MSRLKLGCLTFLGLFTLAAGYFFFMLWRGTPLRAEPPLLLSGSIYYIHRDPADRILKVYRQDAALTDTPELAVDHSGCQEQNCNINEIWWVDGGLEYTAHYQGTWHIYRDGRPVRPEDPSKPGVGNLHEGAANRRGSLVVDDQVVLEFRGRYNMKFAPGYQPQMWIGEDRRYLMFTYNGYTNGDLALLAYAIGPGERRHGGYIWDRETGQVHRFVDAYKLAWVPTP